MRFSISAEALIALICSLVLAFEAGTMATGPVRRERERERERPQNVRQISLRARSGPQRWVF